MQVQIDLSPRHPSRIEVRWESTSSSEFQYALREIKGYGDAKFVGKDKPAGPYWHVPLEMSTCHELRESFGDMLVVSKRLGDWYRLTRDTSQRMANIGAALTADLERLPTSLPWLDDTLHPYQRVGAKFVANGRDVLIADQPGLGKTLETIAGIAEAGMIAGAHLVVAPKTALRTVWENEIHRWGTGAVYVFTGTKRQKQEIIKAFDTDPAATKWLVMNPEGLRLKKVMTDRLDSRTMKEGYTLVPDWPEIHDREWSSITIDECHKGAIRNPDTITAKSIYSLRVAEGGVRIALSGTPMKNRAIDLWGILHWLDPDRWSSKWAFANRYCVVTDNGFGKVIGKIRPDKEAELAGVLATVMLRRTKGEVLTELPPKQYVDVWCEMNPKQQKQYDKMVAEAEVRLSDGEKLVATNVLTEFLRLKQFAICRYDGTGDNNQPVGPTEDSGKLEQLMALLDERGIFESDINPTEAEKVVVFSQFSQVVEMVAKALAKKGAVVTQITGGFSGQVTPVGQRKMTREEVQNAFQADGGPNVLCMTTTAGGVAITLDRASTVMFLDETWSPADMEQAEDRVHRASRMHQVTIYKLRTPATVDEYIQETVRDKEDGARAILDDPRAALRGK